MIVQQELECEHFSNFVSLIDGTSGGIYAIIKVPKRKVRETSSR